MTHLFNFDSFTCDRMHTQAAGITRLFRRGSCSCGLLPDLGPGHQEDPASGVRFRDSLAVEPDVADGDPGWAVARRQRGWNLRGVGREKALALVDRLRALSSLG